MAIRRRSIHTLRECEAREAVETLGLGADDLTFAAQRREPRGGDTLILSYAG